MSLTRAQVAEAFSDHRFTQTFPYLAEDVGWTLVGEQTLEGKADVIATCEESAAYLATVETEFSRFKVIVGDDDVAVDTRATYTDGDGMVTTVASCDIYEFGGDGLVSAITSYTVETD